MNRTTFFAYARRAPFGGRLSRSQVDGMNKILDEWAWHRLTDDRWLAYILATAFHETAGKMQPIREMGGEAYLKKKPYYPWVGEGLVQVTWEANHRKFGATKPGQLLTWPIALRAIFDGMTKGMFTGKKLSDYFSATVDDPIGARRIVNGTDKAKLIAGYHKNFLDAIRAAQEAQPADVKDEDAKPDDVPASQSGSVGTIAVSTGAAAASSLVAGVQNPWALAALGLIIVAGGVFAWLILSGRLTINRSKAV
ncbi:hypothetical protein [Bosea minatitlanensis]|uniref:Chitinase n=1 Tax=Bosea minatitlanensis TaxID=128782 RepID=A0ABW0F0G0_9HYPH|nr:hypothetical protein [Bosea minatitlanensis]MCT4492695.1 hypothetical protein [Bosea minatitlanensis]